MKATNTRATRTTKKPSHSSSKSPLDQRLLAYALGGGAIALAATPAEAAVILSGIQNVEVASLGPDSVINNFATVNLVPGDGTSPTFEFGWANGKVTGLQGGVSNQDFNVVVSSGQSLSNLPTGATVGPLANVDPKAYPKYKGAGVPAYYQTNEGAWTAGNWSAGGSGYAGFSFIDGSSQTHYGWMELTVPTTSAAGQKLTLVQWAWESEANTPITISPGSASVPEIDPASAGSALALLVGGLALVEQQLGFAAGAAGLRAWRKRRQAVA